MTRDDCGPLKMALICSCANGQHEPLCEVHGDPRDTSIGPQVIPFPLARAPVMQAVTVTVLVPNRDAVRAAELVADALVAAGVLYSGEIEVHKA